MTERYQIIAPIASGGRGTVYRAWDKTLSRDVAFKRMDGSGPGADQLLREARALHGVHHPNIVTVHEYGTDDEGPYLVMELIKGRTLDELLAKSALNDHDFDQLVRQTLAGLSSAHEAGVIHRDLKPGNLMIPWDTARGFQVKIIDFGLAQGTAAAPQETSEGSVHFMAPEQFGSAMVDVRTDLYALGAIYYYALTRHLPFEGESSPQVIVAHLHHRVTPLAELRPDLSPALCAWVNRLMSVKPDDRPDSAAEAQDMYKMIVSTADEPVIAAAVVPEEPETVLVPLMEENEAPVPVLAIAESEAPARPATARPATSRSATPATPAAKASPPAAKPRATEGAAHAAAAPPQVRPLAHAPAEPAAIPGRTGRSRPFPIHLVVVPCVLLFGGIFAFIIYLKSKGEPERLQKLEALAAAERPEGSDLDVRMLLDYLDQPAHRDSAARALARLQGGAYIDEMIAAHLPAVHGKGACASLTEVVGRRDITAAFPDVVTLVNDQRPEVRKAAWTTLAEITEAADMPDLLAATRKSTVKERDMAEEAVVTAISNARDRLKSTQAALIAYKGAMDDAGIRSLLLNVIIRVGGTDTLPIIREAVSDPEEKVRQAAIYGLAQFPSHEPLGIITERFPKEEDETCRKFLLIAAGQLIGNPGPATQDSLAGQAISLFEATKNDDEKARALSVVSRIATPASVKFFMESAQGESPDLKREIRQIGLSLRDRLSRIIPIPLEGPPTPLPAAQAELTDTGAIVYANDALEHWTSTDDTAAWLIQIPQPGDYEIGIYQAHTGPGIGTYEVQVAGQSLLTTAVKTATDKDFKGFTINKVTIPQAGHYIVRMQPRKIPEGESLLRLQKLTMKKVGAKGGA